MNYVHISVPTTLEIYGFCSHQGTTALWDHATAWVNDVAKFSELTRLQLNDAKTEVQWCTPSHCQHQLPTLSLLVGASSIVPIKKVRYLGIHVNSDLIIRTNLSRTVSSCFSILREIRSICRSISRPVLLSLVTSLFCHSLITVAPPSLDCPDTN